MVKMKTVYTCQNCGAEHSKWAGQCSQCGEWNTLVEEIKEQKKASKLSRGKEGGGIAQKAVRLSEVKPDSSKRDRITSGSAEFDRVLGGGMVRGSVILIGGEPGIGKSTLLTQVAMKIANGGAEVDFATAEKEAASRRAQDDVDDKVLYVCGEESVGQVALRVRRLAGQTTSDSPGEKRFESLMLLAETDVDHVVAVAEAEKPVVMIVDSIQTMATNDLTGMMGSVGQVREAANRLIALAKRTGIIIFLVGHVTKEGAIAGPKVLEHMVDAVITLEGERTGMWRLARSFKNRFGPTDEVGVFEHWEEGLRDVVNPSGAFLEESQEGKPGRVTVCVMEGTRPVLVEIQALVVRSQLAIPRRVVQGVLLPRVQLIAAVLTKHVRLQLSEMDIFVNVVGGLKIMEPAADLGIALAIASSYKNKAVPSQSVIMGEVGLLGEVRKVSQLEKRVKEAKKLGYKKVWSPENTKNVIEVVRGL